MQSNIPSTCLQEAVGRAHHYDFANIIPVNFVVIFILPSYLHFSGKLFPTGSSSGLNIWKVRPLSCKRTVNMLVFDYKAASPKLFRRLTVLPLCMSVYHAAFAKAAGHRGRAGVVGFIYHLQTFTFRSSLNLQTFLPTCRIYHKYPLQLKYILQRMDTAKL